MEMTPGQWIKSQRERRKMTQPQLAEKLGYHVRSVAKWEADEGVPKKPTRIMLHNIFNRKCATWPN